MGAFFGVIGFFAIIIGLILVLVNLIRKKPKKKMVIVAGVGLVMLIIGFIIDPIDAEDLEAANKSKVAQVDDAKTKEIEKADKEKEAELAATEAEEAQEKADAKKKEEKEMKIKEEEEKAEEAKKAESVKKENAEKKNIEEEKKKTKIADKEKADQEKKKKEEEKKKTKIVEKEKAEKEKKNKKEEEKKNKDKKKAETKEKPKQEDTTEKKILKNFSSVDKVNIEGNVLTVKQEAKTYWDETSILKHNVYELFEALNEGFKDSSVNEGVVTISTVMVDNKGNESIDDIIDYTYTRESFEELNYKKFAEMSYSQTWRILNEADTYWIHTGIYSKINSDYRNNLQFGPAKTN